MPAVMETQKARSVDQVQLEIAFNWRWVKSTLRSKAMANAVIALQFIIYQSILASEHKRAVIDTLEIVKTVLDL